MLNRVQKFFDSNCILNNNQHGFRPQYRAVIAMVQFLNLIHDAFKRKEFVLALFIDVAKAFDYLNHCILSRKLEANGFRGNALNWFKSY